ncbi:YkvA family protein [Limibacter armeniacum]|uniref:YkvA family protein n=1 Tax=Limibacter armeniacum TaxID=466084 RepID=UPI002FE66220
MNRNKAEKKYDSYKRKKLSNADVAVAKEKLGKLGEQKENFRLLLNMVKDSWDGSFKLDKWAIAIITAAIIYVVAPVDAVPDFAPIVGWLDDIGIVSLAIAQLGKVVDDYRAFKNVAFTETETYVENQF